MQTILIIINGVVVNSLTVEGAAHISEDGTNLTLSDGSVRSLPGGRYFVQPGAGIGWVMAEGKLQAPTSPHAKAEFKETVATWDKEGAAP